MSVHLTNSLELFLELKNWNKNTISNRTKLTAQERGKCTFNIGTLNSQTKRITLDYGLYIPELDSNLLYAQSRTQKHFVVTVKYDMCLITKRNILVSEAKTDEA